MNPTTLKRPKIKTVYSLSRSSHSLNQLCLITQMLSKNPLRRAVDKRKEGFLTRN